MKKVIIVGASYAGLNAAKKLTQNSQVEVLLFDKSDYHYIQVESYGFIATVYDIFDITINIKDSVKKFNGNIKFFKNKVQSFNSNTKIVTTVDNKEFTYDYLIIATGSLTNFPIQVPNIQKYSRGIKTLECASEIEQTFDALVNEVVWEQKTHNNRTYNFVIGGAGLSGVEIASEMATLLQDKLSVSKDKLSKINITIIDGMKTVLPNMDERLITCCHKRLEELGIKIYLGSFIKDVDENKIYLTDDKEIAYDYFVFTGGIKAITLDSNKTYEVNKLNQYITDKYLRLKDEKDIFVIGDAAQSMINDKYSPPTAQIATQAGEYVATSIQNELNNNPNSVFNFKSGGVLISLGGNYAIGLLYDKIFIKGYLAYLLQRYVINTHKKKFL